MSEPIWVRALIYHSYHNVLREPDTFYQVDSAEDLETVKAQRVAVQDTPPAKAQRQAPAQPAQPASQLAAEPAKPVGPMTTTDFTVGGVRHGTKKP